MKLFLIAGEPSGDNLGAALMAGLRQLAPDVEFVGIGGPGMEAQRADVIVGGLCVLVAIMRRFALDECLVSEADILDGLVASLR